MYQDIDEFGPVPTHEADRLIPKLLNVWACATVSGQIDAAVAAARELTPKVNETKAERCERGNGSLRCRR